ncbi:MAG TPA: SAM-dependent methyltransferase [Actinophytocola sp.]|uniref:SAM-dependent methyltransferase n=1 Tax=Actinophytocola sp. TaxID=1872138 RepID=UPI002DDD995B|nr:SAM-dependent methyltransferase [Actinophytocola sp.]HEV2783730.1 SAM-dependent methyltransferase [Actinophytocola sp.]
MVVLTSSWVPETVNVDRPSAARVYDYLLGGGHNFAGDRAMAERLASVLPAPDMARMNRGFLRRAVLFLVEQGIRQFLDLGSGIPTVGNVHEVAQQVCPETRVVYVDYEPVAVAHSELLLEGNDLAAVIQADMREPEAVLGSPTTKRLIDFSEPLGLLMVGVVQFIPDSDDPWGMAARYRDVLPAGSYLALSAMTSDSAPAGMADAVRMCGFSQDPIHPRTHAEIVRMFDGFELVAPGVVYTPQWRPERPDDGRDDWKRSNMYAGVGYKP